MSHFEEFQSVYRLIFNHPPALKGFRLGGGKGMGFDVSSCGVRFGSLAARSLFDSGV